MLTLISRTQVLMHKPDLETFRHLASEAGLVPVYREIVADLDTPLTIFAKVAAFDSHAFLFESLEGGEKWAECEVVLRGREENVE